MNLKEEIVNALRTEAEYRESRDNLFESIKLFQLSAHVENARCGTCANGKKNFEYVYCDFLDKLMLKDHGCWKYEPKEKVK